MKFRYVRLRDDQVPISGQGGHPVNLAVIPDDAVQDWSRCDVCDGTDVGHYCEMHMQALRRVSEGMAERARKSLETIEAYSGDAGDETA